jgi:hypothetical protein
MGDYWKPKAAPPTDEQLRNLARKTRESLDAQDPEVFERAYVAGFAKSYRDE